MNDTISEAFEKASAIAKSKNIENDIDRLPEPVGTFLLVYSAQGIIDNGGYYHFFESDWPNRPPYTQFIEAYEEIGCTEQAKDFGRVVSSFPFADPHLKSDERQQYMKKNYDEANLEIKGWGDKLCGDSEVWDKLRIYYKQNEKAFA